MTYDRLFKNRISKLVIDSNIKRKIILIRYRLKYIGRFVIFSLFCNCNSAERQHSAGYPYLGTAVRSIKLVTGFYLKMVNNCRYFRSSGNLLGLKIFLSNKYL